jgi:hypothetical protein
MFSSYFICCNHFTSLANEIFYARKVDFFDKIKEVVFSQLFPCVTVALPVFVSICHIPTSHVQSKCGWVMIKNVEHMNIGSDWFVQYDDYLCKGEAKMKERTDKKNPNEKHVLNHEVFTLRTRICVQNDFLRETFC